MKFQMAEGAILISHPFLKDPHFKRTVVIICEHNAKGSFGFVVNKLLKHEGKCTTINYSDNFLLHLGGPVEKDTLHFLHTRPDVIGGGRHLWDGIYWGGNYEEAMEAITLQSVMPSELKFFLGYSGWGSGQLQQECEADTWMVDVAMRKIIFHEPVEDIWKKSLEAMGDEYEQMANYPIDPRLN